MPIPDFQAVFLPLLKLVAKHKHLPVRDAVQMISDEFNLTENERRALLPSGKSIIIQNRIGWAKTYLKKAGLLSNPERGVLEITERGKKVLGENLKEIKVKYLRQFPEFLAFHQHIPSDEKNINVLKDLDSSPGTPEEVLEEAHSQLKNEVLTEMIEKIKSCSPQFFEQLVVDTIVKMGYGGSRKDAGKAIGQSGDEGLDGIINEDRLGLDVIYLQAKRWENKITRPEIQKFSGALQGKRAKKGIFITTSDFTDEAIEFVKNIEAKIILISGRQLAELMWEHNIGVNTFSIYEVKKIELDYFSE